MTAPSGDAASAFLDTVFVSARTHRHWQDRAVSPDMLRRLYETARFGPTAFNSNPLRILFLTSETARTRLAPALSEANRARAMGAPVIALFATDNGFTRHLHRLSPRLDAAAEFRDPGYTAETAFRNASLQAAYCMIVARAMGLDCGPMSGFNAGMVDSLFFENGEWRCNFICAMGYGSGEAMRPRAQRLDFSEACRIL